MRIALSLCLALLPASLPVLAQAAAPVSSQKAAPIVTQTATSVSTRAMPTVARRATAATATAPAANAPAAGNITDVEVVLVSGQYTGPGLWKVSKGDHALWILGTVSPVPNKMDWYSPQAESVLAQTQEIIGEPGFVSSVGVGGMFKMAFAMPTMLRARKNPDGKTLRDVLPADLYARWSALKPVYLGNDMVVEEWRPMFAAGELYQAAIKRSGLINGTGVRKRLGERIDEVEKEHKIKRTSTTISTQIKDPKGLAKSFARAELDDVQCFRSVLDRLELDVANAAQRANAWADGDMLELTRLFRRGDVTPCYEAVANTEAARSLGMGDAIARSQALWLQSAEAALADNHTSFATLPVGELLQANGLLARLQAKGYAVVGPE